jgi:hypothetical protein
MTTGWPSNTLEHGLYGELLKKYVNNGEVDYQGFKIEEAKLNKYLAVLENTNTKALSVNDQFAFYVNAYNAWTIKLILNAYPGVISVKDLGSLFKSPWKKKICRIDGAIITLDNIENDILRSRFKDPRVHFALNCASKGCPPLKSQPYRGVVLNNQLEASATAFINNPSFNHLKENTLYVSKIFKWFAGDFNKDIVGYFLKYAKGDLRANLEIRKKRIKVKYLDYDWSLNGK